MAERDLRSKRSFVKALRSDKSVSSVQSAYRRARHEAALSHSHNSCCIDNTIASGSLYTQPQGPYVDGTIIHPCSHVVHCPANCISTSWIHPYSYERCHNLSAQRSCACYPVHSGSRQGHELERVCLAACTDTGLHQELFCLLPCIGWQVGDLLVE